MATMAMNRAGAPVTAIQGRGPRARREAWRWTKLVLGLSTYGLTISLMLRSGLGLGPWDAFHQGLGAHVGMTVGVASIVVGVVIVAGTMFLGVRPGIGTLLNMVWIGIAIDLVLPYVPPAGGLAAGLAYYALGLALNGLATGMYISAGLGKGPRDGLMIVTAERTGWTVSRVRTGIELSVLALGWLLGGSIGLGTVLFTLLVGPAAQAGLKLFGALPAPAATATPTEARRKAA